MHNYFASPVNETDYATLEYHAAENSVSSTKMQLGLDDTTQQYTSSDEQEVASSVRMFSCIACT